jgi:hypothetical protein
MRTGAAWLSLSVPALGEPREQTLNRGGHAEPVGQHLGHLAHGGEMTPVTGQRARQPPRDLGCASRGRAARRRERAHDPGHHVQPRPEHDGCPVDMERIVGTERLGGELRVRRASDVEEEARVVRLRRRLGVDAQALGEAGGDHRAAEPVLELHPERQVRRQ